jgi:hypothetical protein
MKDVYIEVEALWNNHGVQMFPTYEAFRTGKHRYMRNQKKAFGKTPKALK